MPDEATGKTGVPSESRQKPERPRDHLGRPLPWDAENLLHLPDLDAMSADENHEIARRFVAQENWFGAHEAWETAWKKARGTGDEEFFKGLSQMGAGYVHLRRGNAHGAVTLWRRAAGRIARYPDGHRGVPTTSLTRRLEIDIASVDDGSLEPGETATLVPPDV